MKKNKSFTKFFIIAQGRSGSNLLRSYLNGHPEIFCYDEPFNFMRCRYLKQENSIPVIVQEHLRKARRSGYRTIGMKLLYGQPMINGITVNRIWNLIFKNEFLVIHNTRKNLIDSFVSLRLAHANNKWTTGAYDNDVKIRLDVNDFIGWSEETLSMTKFVEGFFNGRRPYFRIDYEDINQPMLYQLQKFIGVEPIELDNSLGLKKQRVKKMSSYVSNLDVFFNALLKDSKNHIWAAMIEDILRQQ